MTDYKTFKKIGYKQAFIAITAGLAIAYLIMSLMAGPLWLFHFDYIGTILFAVTVIYIVGYFIGGLTGSWISKHSRLAILFGIIAGFLIVWIATFFGSLIGYINEGLPNKTEISEPVHDYIYKPMALVTIYGLPAIILVGIWLGISIKKKVENILNNQHSSHQAQ